MNTERGWRGGERQTFWLARALERSGHRNWIAARPGDALARAADAAGLPVFPLSPLGEWDLWAAARLRGVLRRERIDVLHAHTGHAVGLAALARRGVSSRLVATRRVDFPLSRNPFGRWKRGAVDAWAAISGRVRETLLDAGVPAQRVEVIPSGNDPSDYPRAADRDRLRAARGFAPDERIIVHVGALVPHKDQSTLLRAFARLPPLDPPPRLLVLGEGPRRAALEAEAAALGLEDRVRFLGHRPDVLEYTAMADLFVFSSAEEGLGTALLDALTLGVPTAATAAGGVPDLYGGADAPELSPPGDPDRLAAGMAAALLNPDEARRRVERGRARAALFTVDAMAAAYASLYARLPERPCPA